MEEIFHPRLDILPPEQRRLWDELGSVPTEFVLYGGTAIALHLGHRDSVDFDFFANVAVDPDDLLERCEFLSGAEVVQREHNTLTCIVDRGGPVQVSFFGVPKLPRLRPPLRIAEPRLSIASLIDLGGAKAAVIQKRAEPKDYIDVDALITHGIELSVMLSAAMTMYPSLNPQVTLKALTYFGDGELVRLPVDLRHRLLDAVKHVDLDRLPPLTAKGSLE